MKNKKIRSFFKLSYYLFSGVAIFLLLLFFQFENKIFSYAQTQIQPKTLEDLRKANPDELARLNVFDSRKYNIITKVKDQGNTNLCWSYTTMAVSEASILRDGLWDTKINGELDLDENNNAYVTLNNNGTIDPLGLTSNDKIGIGVFNSGYNTGHAFQRILSTWKSPNMNKPNNQFHDALFKLEDVIQVDPSDHYAIKRAIAAYGAVTVGYNPHRFSMDYYYNDNATTFGKGGGHAVTIVGWDDTIPAERYNKANYINETQNGGWIVKNSWGHYGPGKGFFYMSYGSKLRNINAVKYAPADKYDFNYHYDSNGDNYNIFTHDESQKYEKYANIFPVKKASLTKKEMLKAVNIGVSHPNTTINVEIYKNINAISGDVKNPANNPENGIKVITLQKKVRDAGNYTIPLENPIELEANTFFSVVVSLLNNNPKTHVLGSTENINSKNDMSYVYNNDNWKSIKNYQDNSALRIKAFTKLENRNELIEKDLKYVNIKFIHPSDYRYKDLIDNNHFSLSSDESFLEFNKDYTFNFDDIKYNLNPPNQSISDNQQIGSVTITFRGINKWKGSKKINLPILIGHLDASGLIGFTQDPNHPRKASIKVTNNIINTSQITLPLNYIFISNISLKDGINTTGILYKGSDELCWRNNYFEITIIREKDNSSISPNPKNINELDIFISDPIDNLIYNGLPHTPHIIVKDQGKVLALNTDYTVSYQSNIEPGIANIIIECIGKYEGKIIKKFNINKISNSISNFLLGINNIPHAHVVYGIPIFKYFKDDKGIIEINEWETKLPGIYYVQAFSVDTNHYKGEKSVIIKFEVVRSENLDDLKDSIVTVNGSEFIYNTLKHEPGISIKLKEKTITSGFKIIYFSNINAGIATITIVGDNILLIGFKEVNFEIKKATNTINVVKNKNKYDIKTKFGSYHIKYYSDSHGKNEIEKPIIPGKYYQRFFSSSNENYNSDSSDIFEYIVNKKTEMLQTDNENKTGSKRSFFKNNKIRFMFIIIFIPCISVIIISSLIICLLIKRKRNKKK